MCEGLLGTHAPLEACLLAIFTSDYDGSTLSQVHIWEGVSWGRSKWGSMTFFI